MKTPRNPNYLRVKIVEKFPNGYFKVNLINFKIHNNSNFTCFKFKVICLDIGYYEVNVKPEYLYELITEFRDKPDYKAKKCCLIGVYPMGTSNGKWSSVAKDYTSDTLTDNFVYVTFKVIQIKTNY
jgi:hypothetical protein